MNRDGFRFGYALSPAVLWLPAALLAATSACAGDVSPPAALCDPPDSACDGVCVALRSDRSNCGACGVACSVGEACVAGACETRDDGSGGGDSGSGSAGVGGSGPECGGDRALQRCGGECVDTRTDPNHCGKCGSACEPGRACVGAVCRRTCLEGLTDCGGACVDLTADPLHCGQCDRACDPGRPCEGGACGCSAEPSQDIGSEVPQRVSGTTLGADDSRSLSCAGSGAADQTFLFTAPRAGTYLFDTFEASHDTALGALRADTCAELACNDDAGGVQSQIAVDLAEGEPILVVVSGAEGDFTLRVGEPGPVQCTPTALEPVVPQTVVGSTVGLEDSVSATCDYTSSLDATYTFTAPEDGLYVFSARSAVSELLVEVLDGGTCTGDSLNCHFGFGESIAVAEIEAGKTVLVAVASPVTAMREFTLDVFEAPACPGVDLGSTVPQTVTGNNEELPNVLAPCFSPTSGGEATFGFTAPRDGVYMFDATGSSFPVLLEVRRDGCTGEVVTCLDGTSDPARATVPLASGDTAVLVLDSHGDAGDYALEITELACPIIDLGSTAPQTVTGTTADFSDVLAPGCGYSGGREATYLFTAPADALYTFDTEGSTFDTLLDVRDGSCAGPSLKCNDNADPTGVLTHSRLSVRLDAGQSVVVSVDSYEASGEYTLSVTRQEAPPCPLFDLGDSVPQTVTGNNEGYADILTPGCAGGPGGEATYAFTAPAEGYYDISTAGSTVETVLSVRDGGCGGDELACESDGRSSSAIVRLDARQAVLISVEASGEGGDYMLNVSPFGVPGTCAAPVALEPSVPLSTEGTTAEGRDVAEASCGGSDAPDVAYSFTAPEAGTYTIDTFGSEFDTVLAVFDGSCGGEELACSDDVEIDEWFEPVSELEVPLEAGQTVVIVVDGYMESGHYELNIEL
ncbi:MXAN_6577-like cysteine-rich protein [Sorangium sp. So ce861]|uniref:MXAN_6577-like cysteine-rich protein n=1 Tax=Sorangium sp. So ce861 TaxID=3133323 RepID=UPI003F63A074